MILRVSLLLLLIIGVSGCSSTNKLYYDSLKLLLADRNVEVDLAHVRQAQFDLMKVELNERSPAVLVLTFLERGLHKWGSGDGAVLTFDGDRLIRTSGLQHDLLITTSNTAAPKINNSLIPKHWMYSVDVDGLVYGQQASSLWQKEPAIEVTFFDNQIEVTPITQTVTMIDTTGILDRRYQWTNTYWVANKTDDVIYSEQTINPTGDQFKFTYLSRIARLVDTQEKAK